MVREVEQFPGDPADHVVLMIEDLKIHRKEIAGGIPSFRIHDEVSGGEHGFLLDFGGLPAIDFNNGRRQKGEFLHQGAEFLAVMAEDGQPAHQGRLAFHDENRLAVCIHHIEFSPEAEGFLGNIQVVHKTILSAAAFCLAFCFHLRLQIRLRKALAGKDRQREGKWSFQFRHPLLQSGAEYGTIKTQGGTNMLEANILLFLETAEKESVPKAAKALHMSEDEAWKLLDGLQEQLHTELFTNTHKRMRLTRMDEKFYHGCKRIQEMADNLMEEMDYVPVPRLTIAFTGSRDNQSLMELTSFYKASHPQVTFASSKKPLEECLQEVASGSSDVCFGPKPSGKLSKELQAIPLFDYEVCLLFLKDHPFAQKKSIDAKDLAKENLICLGRQYGESFYCHPLDVCGLPGTRSPFTKEVRSVEELVAAIDMEEGIGLASKSQLDLNAIEQAGMHSVCFAVPYCLFLARDEARKDVLDFAEAAKAFYAARRSAPSEKPVQASA